MAQTRHVMMLHSGGLRSLIALAVLLNRHERVRITPVFTHDGRDNTAQRLEHAHRQADHFQLHRVDELRIPHLYNQPTAKAADGLPAAKLATPQLLLGTFAHAAEHQIGSVVWPQSCDGRSTEISRLSILRHSMMQMLENDLIQAPALEVPLLRYTDRQLIELGEGLGVPWETAWSCAMNVEQPCASCPACRRRIAAFRAAGVIDTAFENQRRLQRSA